VKKFFSRNFHVLLLAVLLAPLFYINVKDSVDWGDDFAQYFIQARNILEHRPQTDNGLVFDQQTGEYALQAYPAGFPLILATAWKCFGDSIRASSIMLSFFFFMFGLVSFFYFRKYFPAIACVLLALVVMYNPFNIGFKREILSDVPFAFFLLAAVLLFQSQKKNSLQYVFTGMAWGFAMSIRGIGAVLFLAAGFFLLHGVVRVALKKELRGDFISSLKKTVVVCVSALAFYLLLNAVLFPVPSGGILRFYADATRGEDFGKWILLNLDYYYEVFLNFFATMGGGFQWLSTATKFIMLGLILPGIVIAWRKKIEFDDWVFLVYMIVLFIYPYLGGGFRFLLPVLPFLLKYIFIAFNTLFNYAKIKSPKPVYVFLLAVLVQYTPGLIDQVNSMDVPEQGPQEPPAVETFDYISQHLPVDAVIVFIKPRALSFYSGKKAAYVARNITSEKLPGLFRRMNAHYFLICNENDEVNDVMLKNFVIENKNELQLIWQNSFFDLYAGLK